MNRVVVLVLVTVCLACNRIPDDSDRVRSGKQHAVQSGPSGEFQKSPELAAPKPIAEHKEPIPGNEFTPLVRPDHVRSTEENIGSPTWPQQLLAKQKWKEKEQQKKKTIPL